MGQKKYHHGDLKNALINAGIAILAEEGAGALSLRKVARRAGVSHAAPYAHFADKQTLIAAIAADGHRQIYARLTAVMENDAGDVRSLFLHAVWAYVQFGLDSPAHYRVTFSGVIQDEHSYPEFVELSQRNLNLLKEIVEQCRSAGILAEDGVDADVQAAVLWGLIHGLVSLMIQGQLPSELLSQNPPEKLVIAMLRQVVRVPISEEMLK